MAAKYIKLFLKERGKYVLEKIKVIICGALGKMGRATVQAVFNEPEMELAGLIDIESKNERLSQLITGELSAQMDTLQVEADLSKLLERVNTDVLIDFTNPRSVFDNACTALMHKITCVIGTSGLNEIEIQELEKLAIGNNVGIAIIPNFAIGAVLMMKFAQQAAHYLKDVEIIELHHNQKVDAPSGTALKTAEVILESRGDLPLRDFKEIEKIPGCRGGEHEQIHIHSVRLPGLIAHQEVIFGGMGQSLTIRHDSYDRGSFMPGVIMVTKKMLEFKGLVHGMEKLF